MGPAARRPVPLAEQAVATVDRQVDLEAGPLAGGALDTDRPAQGLDPVGQADEPGAQPGAAPPTPSSRTDRCRWPSRASARTWVTDAWAYLAALARASETT